MSWQALKSCWADKNHILGLDVSLVLAKGKVFRKKQKFSLRPIGNYLDFSYYCWIASSCSPKVFLALLFYFQAFQKAQVLKNDPRLDGHFVQYGREFSHLKSQILDVLTYILHIDRISGEGADRVSALGLKKLCNMETATNMRFSMFSSPNHMLMYSIHRLLDYFWQD